MFLRRLNRKGVKTGADHEFWAVVWPQDYDAFMRRLIDRRAIEAMKAATRKAIPKSKFALATSPSGKPGGGYPVDTRGRAIAAKGRAKQAVNAGRMSPATEKKIDAKANARLKGK
jgi:hypothetical protein